MLDWDDAVMEPWRIYLKDGTVIVWGEEAPDGLVHGWHCEDCYTPIPFTEAKASETDWGALCMPCREKRGV